MRTDIRDRLADLTDSLPRALDGDLDVDGILRNGRRARRARRASRTAAVVGLAAAVLTGAIVTAGLLSRWNEPRLEVLGQPGTTIAASEFADRVRACAADAGLDGHELTTEQGGRALQWDGPSDAATITRVNAVMDTCVARFVVDPSDTEFVPPGPADRPDGFAHWSAQHPDTRAARHRIRDAMIECLTERGVPAIRLGDEYRMVEATDASGPSAATSSGPVVVACEAAHDPRQPWAVEESAANLAAQRARVADLEAQVEELEAQSRSFDGAPAGEDVDRLEEELESVRNRLRQARRRLDVLQVDADPTP